MAYKCGLNVFPVPLVIVAWRRLEGTHSQQNLRFRISYVTLIFIQLCFGTNEFRNMGFTWMVFLPYLKIKILFVKNGTLQICNISTNILTMILRDMHHAWLLLPLMLAWFTTDHFHLWILQPPQLLDWLPIIRKDRFVYYTNCASSSTSLPTRYRCTRVETFWMFFLNASHHPH